VIHLQGFISFRKIENDHEFQADKSLKKTGEVSFKMECGLSPEWIEK
jgi:hypothetical protein